MLGVKVFLFLYQSQGLKIRSMENYPVGIATPISKMINMPRVGRRLRIRRWTVHLATRRQIKNINRAFIPR
jgi:hypothetical protein